MAIENNDELDRKISEHSANSLRLFEEAGKIEQNSFQLPIAERESAMNEVIALQTEAVAESNKVAQLETVQAAIQLEEIRRQNIAYFYEGFPLIDN